jgi:hypothetical protein
MTTTTIESFNIIGQMKKAFGHYFFVSTKATENQSAKAEIIEVTGSILEHSCQEHNSGKKTTIIYNPESLDSLYGVSFYKYLYGADVELCAWDHTKPAGQQVNTCHRVVVLGVDLDLSALLYLSSAASSVHVYGYRGTFEYIHDITVARYLNNVTLFRAQNGYYSGSKQVEDLENSVAFMMRIMFDGSRAWNNFSQAHLAMQVAHANMGYKPVDSYALKRSRLVCPKSNKSFVSAISFQKEALMYDFKKKLQSFVQDEVRATQHIYDIVPEADEEAYKLYRNKVVDHISRTARQQGWEHKRQRYVGLTIPAIKSQVNDIVDVNAIRNQTTVCVEDLNNATVYYIHGSNRDVTERMAKAFNGDKQWWQGNVLCVHCRKAATDRR